MGIPVYTLPVGHQPHRGTRTKRQAGNGAATRPAAFLRDLAATFLHRPYQRMAETGLSMSYLLGLAVGDAEDQQELSRYQPGPRARSAPNPVSPS